MNGKLCRVTQREIDESELNQRLSDEARAHISQCESCRAFRSERSSLRELVGSLEPVTAPGDFDMRLRARLAAERSGRAARPFIFRLVTGAPDLAGAALVVLLAVSLVWFIERNPAPRTEIAKVPIHETPLTNPAPVSVTSPAPITATLVDGGPQKTDRLNRLSGSGRDSSNKNALAGMRAVDYGTSPAPRIRQIEQKAGEVSLSAPVKPMIISMQDDRGETRKISLPPVSFGAQRLVDSRTPVSFTSNSRSW
jgi:hypothetical protein